jgi:hypothetical protein
MSSKFWRWVRAGRGVRHPAAPRGKERQAQSAGGPGSWSNPANWAGGFSPARGEEVVFATGAAALPGTEPEPQR